MHFCDCTMRSARCQKTERPALHGVSTVAAYSNPSKAQERSAEQEVEKSNNGGADGHGSPRLDRVRAGFRHQPSEGNLHAAEASARRGSEVLAGRCVLCPPYSTLLLLSAELVNSRIVAKPEVTQCGLSELTHYLNACKGSVWKSRAAVEGCCFRIRCDSGKICKVTWGNAQTMSRRCRIPRCLPPDLTSV
jgi:hypothetical protein